MKHIFSNKMRLFSLTVFLLGLVTFGLAFSLKHSKSTQRVESFGFTITSTQTITTTNDGDKRLVAIKIRYQKSTGDWKLVTTYYNPDGTIANNDTGFGQIGKGVFRVDDKQKALDILSPMDSGSSSRLSAQTLQNSPDFLKEDNILGYKTFVHHIKGGDGGGYEEIYYAPDLQGLPIKHVFVSEAGEEVIEPIIIEKGEPSESVFKLPTDYKIEFNTLLMKIENMEAKGQHDGAERTRKFIQQIQATQR